MNIQMNKYTLKKNWNKMDKDQLSRVENIENRKHSSHQSNVWNRMPAAKKDPFEGLTAKPWIQVNKEDQTFSA